MHRRLDSRPYPVGCVAPVMSAPGRERLPWKIRDFFSVRHPPSARPTRAAEMTAQLRSRMDADEKAVLATQFDRADRSRNPISPAQFFGFADKLERFERVFQQRRDPRAIEVFMEPAYMDFARRVSRNEAEGTQYTPCVFKGIDVRRRIAQLRHRRRPESQQARSRPLRKVGFLTETIIAVPDMNAFVRFAPLHSTRQAVIHSANRITAVMGRSPTPAAPLAL